MTRTVRLLVVAATVGLVVGLEAAPAAAHGIGGRADLPVPVSYFIVGAGIAVVISFVVLAVRWPTPRLQEAVSGPARKLGPAAPILGAVGLTALALVVLTGLINREGGRTISPVLVWVYFWLVVPFIAAALGDWWKAISPWRRIVGLVNSGGPERPDLAKRVGMWPAVIALVAFTWLELVSPSSAGPRTLALAAVFYTLYLLFATRYLGVASGLGCAGAFENYNRIIGAISPFRWDADPADGSVTVERPGWLRGLTAFGEEAGFSAFVIVMIGTVTYDGMSGSEWWSENVGSVAREQWFGTLALVATVLVIGAAYWVASAAASSIAGQPRGTIAVARSFAHTLVPIALAYAVAHYFTLVLVEGQILLHAASDPFGLGWDLFGTASWRISWVPSPEFTWYVQVIAIVAGHVAGVVLAHDRALRDFGGRVAVRTQYAMLALMVALTSLGLLILSG
jgi:hypothetical protein